MQFMRRRGNAAPLIAGTPKARRQVRALGAHGAERDRSGAVRGLRVTLAAAWEKIVANPVAERADRPGHCSPVGWEGSRPRTVQVRVASLRCRTASKNLAQIRQGFTQNTQMVRCLARLL